MNAEIGWWAVPAAITLAAIGFAAIKVKREARDDFAFGLAIMGPRYFGTALIVSLAAWLAWLAGWLP